MFGEDSNFKENIVFWKRQMDDVFFIWKGTKEELELFVWHLNGFEYRVQFILENEKEGFLPFRILAYQIWTENSSPKFTRNLRTHRSILTGT